MAEWAWISDVGVLMVEAGTDDEAYEKVIQYRMTTGQTREEAEEWFMKDDRIEPIIGLL